nr:hypothetical protein [Rhodobacter sp. SY28-1]
MGDGLRIMAAGAQPLGDLGKAIGSFLGQDLAGLLGLEAFGVDEAGLEKVALGPVKQVFQGDLVHLLDGVGPVGVDADAVHVGHNQQRRVFQRDSVLLKLGEGGVQVLALALVFPGEAVLAPDIGPAFATR